MRVSLTTVLFSVFFLATTAAAQITPIPGSGCPGAPGISTTGSGQIGTPLSCSCPPSIDRMRVVLGLPSAPITFGTPFMCTNGCVLPMTPLFLLNSPGWRFMIPNDRTLVGQRLIVQCLQTSLNRPCVLLTEATEIRVL